MIAASDIHLKPQEVTQCLQNGIQAIDTKSLQGKFKLWIAEHVLVPKIMWPLQISDIPLSTVEKMGDETEQSN